MAIFECSKLYIYIKDLYSIFKYERINEIMIRDFLICVKNAIPRAVVTLIEYRRKGQIMAFLINNEIDRRIMHVEFFR